MELGDLDLLEMEANGAGSMFRVELPEPSGVVPVRLGGGGSQFTVRRPSGIAARVHLKGWGSGLTLDDQTASGSDVRLQSQAFDPAAPYYDIDIDSSGSQLIIMSG